MSDAPDPTWPRDRARYYDLDTFDQLDDLPMYEELAARTEGPILELAAGSGRLAIPLALAGRRVVAIDDDPAMLERGRRAWDMQRGSVDSDVVEFVEADMTSYRSDVTFGFVLLAINTMLLMPDDDSRLAVLTTARVNLGEGGLLVVDMLDPSSDEMAEYDGRLHLEWLREDPETGEQVTKLISARHDPGAGSLALTQLFDATLAGGGPVRRFVRLDMLHLTEADHWRELAQKAGFGEVDVKGDHLLSPHGAGSHRIILVARLV
jgi:SAM-dependent methyltransferase